MNFLFLTNKIPYPPKDGGAIGFFNLAISLANLGHSIDLLTLNTNKHYYPVEKIPQDLKQKINFHDVYINTDISPIKLLKNLLFSTIPYNAERFISDDFKAKLKSLLAEKEFDIVHIEGLYMCPYIEIVRQNSNAKITLRSHNIEHEIWERLAYEEANLLKKFYLKKLATRIKNFKLNYINKYDFLVPVTGRELQTYNSLGNIKPGFIAPTGITEENNKLFLDNNNSEYPGFFFIGALDWYPNIEGLKWFLENIWTDYVKKYPQNTFSIAGRNAEPNFEKYLSQFPNINYFGEVEDADEFISRGSVLIAPVLSGSGMRVKIIEGMAAAKTIITTTIGTEGIDTTNEINIFIADNPETFLNIMFKLSDNKQIHDEISKNARIFVAENYNNTVIAKNLADFYKRYI
jgi:glycosyltransferase involved in cell wall biosynthesis